MDRLLSVLRATIKAKITPIWTRIKYWTSWSFIQANILTKIREWFSKILNVRPRHKRDYYQFLGLLISRRLAHAVLLVCMVFSLCYLAYNNPFVNLRNGIGTDEVIYNYNSIPLRFAKGNVKIKAKSGYIAYSGNVEKGYASGQGDLMDEEGRMVYTGDFSKNMYNGNGTLYYINGQAKYTGAFVDNLYQGSGTLYRENGTTVYAGDFVKGIKEGQGVLYDATDTPVFKGSFRADDIVYAQLLGKNAEEINEMYTGREQLFQGNDTYVVLMEDIDAFYSAPIENNSIDGQMVPDRVFVAKDSFAYGSEQYKTLSSIKEKFGTPIFEGNSYVTLPEAVGIEWLKGEGYDFTIDVKCMYEKLYEEVNFVTEYTDSETVYLYVYDIDGITYTFMAQNRGDSFFMYVLEK